MPPPPPSPLRSQLARQLTRAPSWMLRYLWVWPLLGAVLISVVGIQVRNRVESTMNVELASRLGTVLNADVAALHLWFSEQMVDAKAMASDERVREAVIQQNDLASGGELAGPALATSAPARTLQAVLEPMVEAHGYLDYVIINPSRRIIGSPHRSMLNRATPPSYEFFLTKTLAGQLAVSRPFARESSILQRAEGPTMFVAAPVFGTNDSIIAILGLRMKPEEEFTRIFSVARMGESGETYAFDRRGMMLTASRFDKELKQLGLIPNVPEATAILNLRVLDPGAELSIGATNIMPRQEWPLTRMAASAVSGTDGVDLKGYRNYRGSEVIGAWAWLQDYEMGVATEVNTEEAFHTLHILRQSFTILFVLLLLSAVALFAFTLLVDRMQASIRKTAVAARRLGQYVLIQEIGRGADGMVYRARHSLLRRPVAVKLLSPESTNEKTIARFEHEVQMTSHLTHPNTIAIYDYGRTPEGVFYYAMEYLTGINLHRLVTQFGPQPEGRVIHILRQICGSLAEAHEIALIHRDIKPANVFVTRRGGVGDMVKVLDFGLVKETHLEAQKDSAIVGTPHFMAPEAITNPRNVDHRIDLFAVGAIGYWLLTGKTLFSENDIKTLLHRQANDSIVPPSHRAPAPISMDLENLIMSCLARDPNARPPDAKTLERELGFCIAADAWTAAEASAWWEANLAGVEEKPTISMPAKTLIIAPRPD